MTQQTNHFSELAIPRVRALICRHNQVLLVRKEGGGRGERYGPPGGGVMPGETLEQALIRECAEELDTLVSPGPLLHVVELFRRKRANLPVKHYIEYVFAGFIDSAVRPDVGPSPDSHQTGLQWVAWSDLTDLPEMTPYLSQCRPDLTGFSRTVYLGVHHDDPFA